jgi:L-amino acid N-acyltransferase YncA
VTDTPTVRRMAPEDWDAVRRIYEGGVATGNATFETAAPAWPAWGAGHLADDRHVACVGPDVLGWAALSPVSERCVYAGVAENSAYVAARARGRGVRLHQRERIGQVDCRWRDTLVLARRSQLV